MSLPLVDFRGKITHETDCVLDAIHLSTGRDRSEIARDALHAWAELKIHEASLIDSRLQRKGLSQQLIAGLNQAYLAQKGAA